MEALSPSQVGLQGQGENASPLQLSKDTRTQQQEKSRHHQGYRVGQVGALSWLISITMVVLYLSMPGLLEQTASVLFRPCTVDCLRQLL